jgi:hypothetical protein
MTSAVVGNWSNLWQYAAKSLNLKNYGSDGEITHPAEGLLCAL